MKYFYLHGLGQSADSWDKVIAATEAPENSVCPELAQLLSGKTAVYSALYSAFSEMCNAEAEKITLCGLSLGGVLALNYAIIHPEKVRALVLIAAQYKMPARLLKLQNALFHLMPRSMFRQTGFGKREFISLCNSMAVLDFSASLSRVTCPVLVICGGKDSANKKASIELAESLPHAQFKEIPGAGHEVNLETPVELAGLLREFYNSI